VLANPFFGLLLSQVYGLQLEVMDREKPNYPAIDLGDQAKRWAFQVTTDESKGKAQNTLNTFVRHGLHHQYDTLKVLVIGKPQKTYSSLKVPSLLRFDPSKDIFGISDLIRDINKLDTPALEAVVRVLDEELTGPTSHKQGGLELVDVCFLEDGSQKPKVE